LNKQKKDIKRGLPYIIVLFIILIYGKVAFGQIQVQTYRLQNGLRVILSPIEDSQAVCLLTYFKTGTRDDPVELKGISNVFKNIRMYSPTRNFNYLEGFLYAKNKGGITSSKIEYDFSYFYQIIQSEDLNITLMLESERFKSLKINTKLFEIQKTRQIQKLNRLIKFNGYYNSYIWTNRKLFENSIYQYPIYGEPNKLINMNKDDIITVFKRYLNPNLITLIITGKFDTVDIKRNIIRYFSDIKATKKKPIKYKALNLKNIASSKSSISEKNVENFVIVGIPAPSILNPYYTHFLFFKYFLLDKRVGNIEYLLKDKNNLDIMIDYKFTGNIEANSLIIGVSSKQKIDVVKARYLILNYFKTLPLIMLKKKKTIKYIKYLMELDYLKRLADPLQRSLILAKSEHFFGNLDINRNILMKIKNIGVENLIKVSKKYFSKDKTVVLFKYKNE